MLRRGVYEAGPCGATTLAAAALLCGALAGCGSTGSRAITQGAQEGPPALGGGETEADVERLLGRPDRVIEVKDEKTGATRVIWIYERTVDVSGSSSVRRITFRDGRALSEENIDAPRSAVSPDIPQDRTTGRDRDW